jgi:hypothetical protein
MPKQDMQKLYPAASEQIASLLGMNANATASVPVAAADEADGVKPINTTASAVSFEAGPGQYVPEDAAVSVVQAGESSKTASSVFRVLAGLVPYIAVFVVSIAVYYVFFSGSSVGTNLIKSVQKKQPTAEELRVKSFEQLKAGEANNYLAWINGFYFRISDDSILGMDRVAPNRLTNFENYLLKLNPKTTMRTVLGSGVSGYKARRSSS